MIGERGRNFVIQLWNDYRWHAAIAAVATLFLIFDKPTGKPPPDRSISKAQADCVDRAFEPFLRRKYGLLAQSDGVTSVQTQIAVRRLEEAYCDAETRCLGGAGDIYHALFAACLANERRESTSGEE